MKTDKQKSKRVASAEAKPDSPATHGSARAIKPPITKKGILIPADNSFEAINSFVNHNPSPHYEELQYALLGIACELEKYREGGVTEEILRRNDGYIKVGKGCVIALASEVVPNAKNQTPPPMA